MVAGHQQERADVEGVAEAPHEGVHLPQLGGHGRVVRTEAVAAVVHASKLPTSTSHGPLSKEDAGRSSDSLAVSFRTS